MSIDGSSATVSGTTLSFVAAAVASGRATGANAAAVVARAANTAAFIFACAETRVTRPYVCYVCPRKAASPAERRNAQARFLPLRRRARQLRLRVQRRLA